MIKEYAPSLSNRGHFLDEIEVYKQKGGRDKFMSLFCYDNSVKEYVKEKGKIAGYNGIIYLAQEHILDVDGETFEEAKDGMEDLVELLKDINVPHKLFFSGRGFHISIPEQSFSWEPHKDLHMYVKEALDSKGIFKFADSAVTDKTRLIRINNTINSKSGLYKSEIHGWMSSIELEDMEIYASKINKKSEYGFQEEVEPVFNVLPKKQVVVKKKEYKKDFVGRQADPLNYPCIQKMLQWRDYGKRHVIALRLAAWFRWRYPEHVVRLIMEDWRKQVSTEEHPLKKEEIDNIVESAYTGHNGKGNNYGCNDKIKDSFCESSCRLFSAKKNNNVISFSDMEADAMKFYQSGIKPLNFIELYGKNFPIYPGELVVIQAPPKSMKTMLVHNWIAHFQKPTYFLEMEMSPRQMYIRHRQIREGISYEQVEESLRAGNLANHDEWLMIDYKTCFSFELQRRIEMLAMTPEIVVIDHLGLMDSNNKDMNGKMEEIMAALKDVAIKNNVVVFAISEMTKMAMDSKNGIPAIAASRGSARIGYTANKVLQLQSYRKGDEVTSLKLECVANREKEGLYINLKPNNCRIEILKEGVSHV